MHDLQFLLQKQCIESERILLSGPSSPDGDSIGACLALQALLLQLGCQQVDVAGKLSFRYNWLPKSSCCLSDNELTASYSMVIILDGDHHRLTQAVKSAFKKAKVTAIIDHHQSTKPKDYTLALIDPNASSTCTLIFELAHAWDCQIDEAIATNLYAGLVFDTGAFRYQNTTAETLKMAESLMTMGIDHSMISAKILSERRPEGVQLFAHVLQNIQYLRNKSITVGIIQLDRFRHFNCIEEDIEGIVEQLLFITGVEVAALCIEQSKQTFKVSLRSRTVVDVAALAHSISQSGGGHIRAAGATVHLPIHTGIEVIKEKLLAAFSQ